MSPTKRPLLSARRHHALRRQYERQEAADERACILDAARAEAAQKKLESLLRRFPDKTRTSAQTQRAHELQAEWIKHRDAVRTLQVNAIIGGTKVGLRARLDLSNVAASIIGIADNYGICLIDIISEVERYIVQETKVTDARGTAVERGRRGYTLSPRLVAWTPPIDAGPVPRRASKR